MHRIAPSAAISRRAAVFRLLAVLAAYGVSFLLARRAMAFSLTAPWFAFVAMVCFLGLASVVEPLRPLAVPRRWRRLRAWEAAGRVHRALGVPAFGVLLRRTPLRFLNTHVYLRGHADPDKVMASLEAAEAAHVWDAVLVVPYMIYAGAERWWDVLVWFAIAQVLGNVYPVLHLRAARHRIGPLVARRRQGSSQG